MSGQRGIPVGRSATEKVDFETFVSFLASQRAKVADGTYKPSPTWTPTPSATLDFIRRAGIPGIKPPEDEPATASVSEEAWARVAAIDPEADPEASVEAYTAAVAAVEDERESARFLQMSTRDQLAASGVDVTNPDVRRAYGFDRR